MDYDELQTVEVEQRDRVLHVRLNRPDVRNAFNGTMVEELEELFGAIGFDDGVRAVVLAGTGKSFCAGADLEWMREQASWTAQQNEAGARQMAEMFLRVARCNKPVIARIHGHALGGGTGLAAAVDIAISTEGCTFGLTEVKLGIVPAVISPHVMQKISAGRARALFLTGERFDGVEAQGIGFVHRAVSDGDLDTAIETTVQHVLAAGPAAVASAKSLIRAVEAISIEDAIAVTAGWIAELRTTPEAIEGMSAFLEKRRPGWM